MVEPWTVLADALLQREALICRLAEGRPPRDFAGLIRMTFDARAARATLVRGTALLGPGLGLMGVASRRPAIALALEAAQADA